MAASPQEGAAVTISLTEVSAGRDVHIKVDTVVRDEQFRRNRRQMLEKVRLIWIKGLLEPSLYHLARVELGLETRQDAVARPFDLLVQRPEQAPHPLPTGIPISHVFDEAGKALLILGAPGAGKTTLLLELTRDLLDRAAQDESHLIPVVFNLSSWAEQRVRLADWLIDELNKRYDVPHTLAKTWVNAGLILPLLDGLDEVAADHREACVETMNAFLSEHGLLPMVVCSRVADYEALTVRLRLPSAVMIQALSRQQVQSSVEQAGTSMAGLRTVLQTDETLWDLLDTPLMLSIAALAYQGRSADEIPSAGTVDEHRTQLFAAYTDAMFKRRAKATPYTREQTERWLAWLARTMKAHDQSVFYLEWMQPDWLPGQRQQRLVTFITSAISGLLCGLGVGLLGWMLSQDLDITLSFGLLSGLLTGLSMGIRNPLIVGLLGGLLSGMSFDLLSWILISQDLSKSLSFGLLGGLLIGLSMGIRNPLIVGLGVGLLGWILSVPLISDVSSLFMWPIVLFAMLLRLLVGYSKEIRPVEKLRWSWAAARYQGINKLFKRWLFGLLVGLVGGLLWGLSLALYSATMIALFSQSKFSYHAELIGVLPEVLLSGLCGGLFSVLFVGVTVGEIGTKSMSNEGIRRSGRNALISGLFGGLVGGLFGGLFSRGDAGIGILFGLFGALVCGLRFGGYACLHHFALRLILWHNNFSPLNYPLFLDSATARIFLRKVGGGYVFVHRMLLEYFAAMQQKSTEQQSPAAKLAQN